MELSKEQYKILEHFYRETKIYIEDLSKFHINKNSTSLSSLVKAHYLKPTDIQPHPNPMIIAGHATSYTITENGKRAYEDFLAHIAQQEYEQQALELQNRQTVSSEEAVIVAKEANSISRNSKQISLISLGVSIVAVIVAIITLICK